MAHSTAQTCLLCPRRSTASTGFCGVHLRSLQPRGTRRQAQRSLRRNPTEDLLKLSSDAMELGEPVPFDANVLHDAWMHSQDPEAMLRLAVLAGVPLQQLVYASAQIARDLLPYATTPRGRDLAEQTIEAVEAWSRGELDIDGVDQIYGVAASTASTLGDDAAYAATAAAGDAARITLDGQFGKGKKFERQDILGALSVAPRQSASQAAMRASQQVPWAQARAAAAEARAQSLRLSAETLRLHIPWSSIEMRL